MNNSTNITSKQQRTKRNAAPPSDDSVKRFKTQTTIKKTDDVANNNTGDKPTSKENTHPDKQNDELIENLIKYLIVMMRLPAAASTILTGCLIKNSKIDSETQLFDKI